MGVEAALASGVKSSCPEAVPMAVTAATAAMSSRLPILNTPFDVPRQHFRFDDEGIRGWGMMPLCTVVGQNGLADFEGSLELLREMTELFPSEFDVRGRRLPSSSYWW
jgi:hypothetical protein